MVRFLTSSFLLAMRFGGTFVGQGLTWLVTLLCMHFWFGRGFAFTGAQHFLLRFAHFSAPYTTSFTLFLFATLVTHTEHTRCALLLFYYYYFPRVIFMVLHTADTLNSICLFATNLLPRPCICAFCAGLVYKNLFGRTFLFGIGFCALRFWRYSAALRNFFIRHLLLAPALRFRFPLPYLCFTPRTLPMPLPALPRSPPLRACHHHRTRAPLPFTTRSSYPRALPFSMPIYHHTYGARILQLVGWLVVRSWWLVGVLILSSLHLLFFFSPATTIHYTLPCLPQFVFPLLTC